MTEILDGSSPGATALGGHDGVEAGPWIGRTSVVAATWALFVGLGLVMIGNGLNGAVLGVRAEAEGFGIAVTGLIMASYFIGFLAGTSFTERALRNVGHIRVFAALASGASSVVLVQALSVEPLTWAVMRFAFGACMAGIYVVVESWLNDLATNETRGRILSIYMIVTMAGLGTGQLMLNLEDTGGFRLFVLVSVMVSMSLMPVTLSATSSPPLVAPEPIGLMSLVKRVPTGVIAGFWSGAATGSLMGMAAVYAATAGMGPGRISAFLFAPMLGALVFQWPIGWLSDHLPRRGVIFLVAVAGIVTALAPLGFHDGAEAAIVAMFLLGGAMFPLYSLVIAYTNDWLRAEEILGASATLVRVNGAGAIVGPLMTGALMASVDPRLFFWSIAGSYCVVAAYVLYRIFAKNPLPMERQHHYIAWPARASAVAASLIPRPGRRGSGVADGSDTGNP